jgi:hypothetical protein
VLEEVASMINTMTPTSEVYRREQHAGPNVHVIKCAAELACSEYRSKRHEPSTRPSSVLLWRAIPGEQHRER